MDTPIKYFVRVDATGRPLGFYPSDIWPTPPSDAVEITPAQYRKWHDGMAIPQYYQLMNGELIACEPPPPVVETIEPAATSGTPGKKKPVEVSPT